MPRRWWADWRALARALRRTWTHTCTSICFVSARLIGGGDLCGGDFFKCSLLTGWSWWSSGNHWRTAVADRCHKPCHFPTCMLLLLFLLFLLLLLVAAMFWCVYNMLMQASLMEVDKRKNSRGKASEDPLSARPPAVLGRLSGVQK